MSPLAITMISAAAVSGFVIGFISGLSERKIQDGIDKAKGLRNRLTDRRARITEKFTCMNQTFQAGAGFYEDGRLGEVFLNCGKAGTHSETMMRDLAICASIAIQYGADPKELRSALCHDDHGQPESPLGVWLQKLEEMEKEARDDHPEI